eukprot:jgi/Tetstr1/449503/TSEL_036592.t1
MAALGPLANLARWYGALTARHWAVQPLVSATLAGSGDTVAQLVGEGKSFMAGELDARRTAAFATFGFAYSGMVIPRWFKFLASQVHCRATHGMFAGWSLRQCNVARIALDMGVQAPLSYVPVFFYTTGLIRGQSLGEASSTLRAKYTETVRNIWFVFTPSQIINFGIIPPQLRILWANSVAFCWLAGLSLVSNRQRMAAEAPVAGKQ